MSYEKTAFGPGSIGALKSGGALSYGPTIGSNDATSLQGRSGSRGAYGIPGMSGYLGMGTNGDTTPTPDYRAQKLAQSSSGAGAQDKSDIFSTTPPAAQEPGMQPLQQQQDQQQTLAPPVEEPLPPWVWVVGGLGVLSLIGGIVWYVTRK